jgi:transposase
MPLNQSQVAQLVVLAQKGYTQRQLAEKFQTSQAAVYRVLQRYEETGTYTRQVGQGCKRKTSTREDHFLSLQARRKRFVTPKRSSVGYRNCYFQQNCFKTLERVI